MDLAAVRATATGQAGVPGAWAAREVWAPGRYHLWGVAGAGSGVPAGQVAGEAAQGCVEPGLMSRLEGETWDSGVCGQSSECSWGCVLSADRGWRVRTGGSGDRVAFAGVGVLCPWEGAGGRLLSELRAVGGTRCRRWPGVMARGPHTVVPALQSSETVGIPPHLPS